MLLLLICNLYYICDPLCEYIFFFVIRCFLQKNHPSYGKEHSVKT